MALEDHLIGTVRKLREMGESLVDLATKVAEEALKDKAPTSPEGTTAKPVQPGAASSANDSAVKKGLTYVVEKFPGPLFRYDN